MSTRWKTTAFATGLLVATAAQAQTVGDQFATLVDDWMALNGASYPQLAQDYGKACLVAAAEPLALSALEIIVAEGEIAAGLAALEVADPESHGIYLPVADSCIWTASAGGHVVSWVEAERRTETAEERALISNCMMDAIYQLSPFAISVILLTSPDLDLLGAFDYLVEEYPSLVGDFVADIDACIG